jgi:hypothetical protein
LERLSQFHNSVAFITDMNALQHSNLCSDRLLANDRRHHATVFRKDALDDFTVLRVAGNDRRSISLRLQSFFADVQSHVCHAGTDIGPVTSKACVRHNRPDVTIKRLSLQITQSLALNSDGLILSSIDNYLQGDRHQKFAFGCSAVTMPVTLDRRNRLGSRL